MGEHTLPGLPRPDAASEHSSDHVWRGDRRADRKQNTTPGPGLHKQNKNRLLNTACGAQQEGNAKIHTNNEYVVL